MKKVFVIVILLSLISGVDSCSTNAPQESPAVSYTPVPELSQEPDAAGLSALNLPAGYSYEKVKEAFLEYLNFKAWCNPSKEPQTAYECTYEIYREGSGGRELFYRYYRELSRELIIRPCRVFIKSF